MTLRREQLTVEELARQRALDRSWKVAQESLADPEFRAYLKASIERVSESEAVPITGEEVLAETHLPRD